MQVGYQVNNKADQAGKVVFFDAYPKEGSIEMDMANNIWTWENNHLKDLVIHEKIVNMLLGGVVQLSLLIVKIISGKRVKQLKNFIVNLEKN
jgi:hypothetical protein